VIIINNGKIVADDSIDNLQHANMKHDVLVVAFEKEIDIALLKELKKLSSFEALGGNKWMLTTTEPDMLRREVMQWALAHDINISSLQAESQSLEDVFRTLTK